MNDDTPAQEHIQPEHQEERPQRFGWRHAIALVIAVAIPIAIFLFRDQLSQFEHLGYLGGFLTMLVGNATVILPVPGLIVVFALGATLNPLLVGLTAGPGAALGELAGYAFGYSGSGVIGNLEIYRRTEAAVKKYGLVVLSLLAAIPNPAFDMAGIVAGALGIKWWQFLIAVWIGKTIQAIAIAYAGALGINTLEPLLK